MAEKDLIININADDAGFKKRLNEAKLETERLNQNFKRLAKTSALAFTGLTAAVGGTILAFRSFQKDFTQVVTLLDKSSFTTKSLNQGIDDLKKGVLDLRAASGESFETLNKGLFDLISAGIPAEQAIKSLTVATELAAAGGTDVAIAVDAITSSINAFGLEADQAAEVAQKFFLAQKNGKTTVEELANSIGVAASNANSFGVSLEEVLAATSATTLAGKSTSQALTGLNQVFANIAKPTADAAAEAQRLGVQFDTAALRSKGLAGFLNDLVTAEGFTTSSVEKLFGSVEAMGVAFALTGEQNKDFTKTLKELQDEAQLTKTFNDALAQSNATVDKAINRLKGSFQAALVTIGEQFAPLIIKVADFLGGLARKIQGANKETLQAIKTFATFALGITGLATVLGTAGLAFLALRNVIKATGIQLLFTNKVVLGFIANIGKTVVATKSFATSLLFTGNVAKAFWLVVGGPIGRIVTAITTVTAGVFAMAKAFGADGGKDKVAEVLETRKQKIIELQDEQSKLADQVLANDGQVSEKAAKRLMQIDEEIAKLRELNEVKSEAPEQVSGTVGAPEEVVGSPEEDGELEAEQVKSQEKINIRARETELKIAEARREAEVLAAIRDEASEEEISAMRKKNALLAEEDRIKLENELLNAELKTEGLTAEREAQIEKQLELNEVELENIQAHRKLLNEQAEENRIAEQEANNLIRQIERDQQVKFNEEELKLLRDHLKGKKQITDKFLLEKLNTQKQANEQFALTQRKSGTAVAKFEKLLNNERVKNVRETSGRLAQLKNSENKTLAKIGKAAAKVNIAIDTAKGAIAAYSSLAPIPLIGPALGAAAAAAIVAYGAEQIGNVNASGAVRGGFVSKGTPGKDTEPFMLAKGESIIPADITPELFNTFRELRNIRDNGGLLNTIAQDAILSPNVQTQTVVSTQGNLDAIGSTIEEAQDEAEPQVVTVDVEIQEDAADFITAQQRENEQLGIGII